MSVITLRVLTLPPHGSIHAADEILSLIVNLAAGKVETGVCEGATFL